MAKPRQIYVTQFTVTDPFQKSSMDYDEVLGWHFSRFDFRVYGIEKFTGNIVCSEKIRKINGRIFQDISGEKYELVGFDTSTDTPRNIELNGFYVNFTQITESVAMRMAEDGYPNVAVKFIDSNGQAREEEGVFDLNVKESTFSLPDGHKYKY